MTPRRIAPWLLLAAIAAFAAWKLHTTHFSFPNFMRICRTVNPAYLLLATLVIYSNNIVRALRWSIFLRPSRTKIPWTALIPAQFIGFSALALFGRIAELIRPLLVARRTALSFPSQVAVVTIERVFDLGAFAAIFALNLLLSPTLQTLPYHTLFHKVGFVIAALTLAIATFVAAVRFAGTRLAALAAQSLPNRFAAPVSTRITAFHAGLDVIDTPLDFALATALSFLLWASIACAYLLVMRAFPAPVHALTVAHVIVLLGFSAVGGIIQLPGVGGGAQVGTISALTLLFAIPQEPAVSAALILWLITSMSVIPAGLLAARLAGTSLTRLAHTPETQPTESPA